MRSGTRSQCKRRWTPRGHRPKCRLKLGYEYCYLYAALNPYSGSLFSLILPDMTKDSFGVFTDHFCGYLDQLYGKHQEQRNKVLLIADGAGAHLEELCTDHGFDFKKLPAASPELNPVELFFEELRKTSPIMCLTLLSRWKHTSSPFSRSIIITHKLSC